MIDVEKKNENEKNETKSKRRTVLVIDDDEFILASFKRILQRYGFEVDTAATGREAIEKSKKRPYDVALVDIRLPDINGADLLPMLQDGSGGGSGGLSDAVKIIVTGFPSTESRTKTLKQGADAYLVKPVKSIDLLALIEEKLGKKSEKEDPSP